MVKIAVAGGSGGVGQEIIDALVAVKKHEILLLTRKDVNGGEPAPQGVTWIHAEYENPKQLVEVLKGVHTVLSFITPQSDPGNVAQRNLIDASVQAGVKRFAPSEWASSSVEYIDWSAGKAGIRSYLQELNKHKKVLEYCLFQPGLFTNYLAHPHQTSKHVMTFETQVDFHNRRAIIRDGGEDDRITLTTAQDLAAVVARAVDYEGEWPLIGGIKGDELTFGQIIALGEKIRGARFEVEKLKTSDLKAGVVKTSWRPMVDHPAIPRETAEAQSAVMLGRLTLAFSVGAFEVSDEWNRLLPDYRFAPAEEFLSDIWRGKP